MPISPVSNMDTFEGSMPAVDAYNRIADIAETKRMIEKTASYTCKVEESGAMFIANHASTPVVFTLPTLASTISGVWYRFFNKGAAAMSIASDPTDKMVTDNDAAADSITFETADHIIGGAVLVFTDGSLWYTFQAKNGLAAGTVATA